MAAATIKQVYDFLKIPGDTLKGFSDQWKALPDADKAQIKEGIGDGTLTY
jgi:hypothetical protein